MFRPRMSMIAEVPLRVLQIPHPLILSHPEPDEGCVEGRPTKHTPSHFPQTVIRDLIRDPLVGVTTGVDLL